MRRQKKEGGRGNNLISTFFFSAIFAISALKLLLNSCDQDVDISLRHKQIECDFVAASCEFSGF